MASLSIEWTGGLSFASAGRGPVLAMASGDRAKLSPMQVLAYAVMGWVLLSVPSAAPADGDECVVRVKSAVPMTDALARIRADIAPKGIKLFMKIDQAKLAGLQHDLAGRGVLRRQLLDDQVAEQAARDDREQDPAVGLLLQGLQGALEADHLAGAEAPRRHQQEAGLLERPGGGGDLRDHVAAVATVGQHLLDAAGLALDPAQPAGQFGDRLVGQVHRHSGSRLDSP